MNASEFAIAANSFRDKLYHHALKFTKNEDDANDLVQDTMVKAIRFSHKFESDTNIKSWLFVIMRNTFINRYRKDKRLQDIVTTEEDITSAHLMVSASKNDSISNFAMNDISRALNSLNAAHRIPFTRYFEGHKYEEIAKELDIPLGTVKTRIHEARIQLKKFLKVYNR